MLKTYAALTPWDRAATTHYITDYTPNRPKDLEQVLAPWAKAKTTLFKLLGNQMRVKVPYRYDMPAREISHKITEIARWGWGPNRIKGTYPDFFRAFAELIDDFPDLLRDHAYLFISEVVRKLASNQLLDQAYWFDKDDAILKIQENTKVLRALRKFLEFYNFEAMDTFEHWRDLVSLALTSKEVETNMVFSIHPLDFLSMSDGGRWTTCMSIMERGMYCGGTVEMMNSNVALVVYLESSSDPTFLAKNGVEIPNKSWRSLFYVTKDIILSGKSYPYGNDDITKQALKVLKDMAKKNLGWTYSYGPQQYHDIMCCGSNENIRRRISQKRPKACGKKRHNIICYTYGMYNDLVEDKEESYFCYRNYVKKPVRLCLSGKATCLTCGKPLDSHDRNANDEEYASLGYIVQCNHCIRRG